MTKSTNVSALHFDWVECAMVVCSSIVQSSNTTVHTHRLSQMCSFTQSNMAVLSKVTLHTEHKRIVSVLHQNEGGIGKSIPDAREISLDPRNLSGLRKSLGRRGWISQYLPSFGGVQTFSHHQQGRIEFNTVNPRIS